MMLIKRNCHLFVWRLGMRKHAKIALSLGFFISLALMAYSSCELPKSLYKIKIILGHFNQYDSGEISIWVTGMEPGEGGKNLGFDEWYPTSGYLDYEVSLSKPEDFTVYVESESQSYTRKFTIENGKGYTFYYNSTNPELAIQGHSVDF